MPFFEQHFDFLRKFRFFLPKFRFLTEISIFDQNFDFKPKLYRLLPAIQTWYYNFSPKTETAEHTKP